MSFVLLWCFAIRTPAYSVYVDGNKKFLVKNKTEVNQALDKMKTAQETTMQQPGTVANNVKMTRTFAKRSDIIASQNVENALRVAMNMKIMAVAVSVKGQSVAWLENIQTAQNLLDTLKTSYTKLEEGEQLVSVAFQEDVQLVEEEISPEQIMSEKQAFDMLTTGTAAPEKYMVKEGDSLWLIARRNDMYVKDIVQTNQLNTDRLKPGMELVLVKSKPLITVLAQVTCERDETIPYDVKVVIDPNAASSVRVSQEGVAGQKHVVYTATKLNGVIDKKVVADEKIIKQAVSKVMVKGGSVQVASRGGGKVTSTGDLDWPLSGSISQYFGGHTGLDICAPVGSTIRAADSGYVVSTSYQGGYGNFVIIDHGNGIVTRYAHCSTFKVSAGQNVSKGQAIAAVGMTGRTTGPHLHFEVLTGGSFVNPLKYLK
ncbi:MAG: M23 family metallopeptidase [Syntrophomonas sp.]